MIIVYLYLPNQFRVINIEYRNHLFKSDSIMEKQEDIEKKEQKNEEKNEETDKQLEELRQQMDKIKMITDLPQSQ